METENKIPTKPDWCYGVHDDILSEIFAVVYDSERRKELEEYLDYKFSK